MALHEQSIGATDEWYTPRYIFDALGCQFDMDVASSKAASWVPASQFIMKDSLSIPWIGFIWMNPPFGERHGLIPWLEKFFNHKNGICLVPDRTSAPWWQHYAVRAELILFVSPKIRFINQAGLEGRAPAQGTCLMGVGQKAVQVIQQATSLGVIMKGV